MSKVRTLESFDKKDLIEFIKRTRSSFARDGERMMVYDLTSIEFNRKSGELAAKMDALHAGMTELSLPQDWSKYKELSDKWKATSRAWDRLYKGLE